MKYRRSLYILLVLVVCVIAILVYHRGREELSNTAGNTAKVESLLLIRQVDFLSGIKERLKDCSKCAALDEKISQRIFGLTSQASNIPSKILSIEKPAKYIHSSRQRRRTRLHDQIQFLMRIEKALTECPKCASVRQQLRKRIVSLRMRLSSKEAYAMEDEVTHLVDQTPPVYFYCPNDANHILLVNWDSGGGALIYEFERPFPPDDLIDALYQYYSAQGWKLLKYDLRQPFELAGSQGGWRKGVGDLRFWTQFWVDGGKNVINVNVSYYDHSEARVVIMYSKRQDVQSALKYYYKIHGASDTKPNKQIIDMVVRDGYNCTNIRPIQ